MSSEEATAPTQANWAPTVQQYGPIAGVFALSLVLFSIVATRTAGDVDEGFYAIAAELVAKGRVLYKDFFYPQAPLLPYLLGIPIKLFGAGFFRERFYLAMVGAATAALLFYQVRRESNWQGGLMAAAFFQFHELSWQWIPSIRAYAIANLAMVGAAVLVSHPEHDPGFLRCIVAGCLVAIAPGVRLLCAPAILAIAAAAALRGARYTAVRGVLLLFGILFAAFRQEPSKAVLAITALFCSVVVLADTSIGAAAKRAGRGLAVVFGASLVGLIVYVGLYRRAPEAFVFGNFGYHAIRSSGGTFSSWQESLGMASAMIGGGSAYDRSASGSQFALMMGLGLGSLGLGNGSLRIAALLLAVTTFMANLRPNPIHEHYFVVVVPTAAWLAGATVGELTREVAAPRKMVLPTALLTVFLLSGINSFYTKWGEGRYGPWDMSQVRPEQLDGGAALVRRVAQQHPGTILAPWSGSAVGVAERILPGYEDHFARNVSWRLTPAQRAMFHTPTHEDFVESIRQRVPAILVFDRECEGQIRDGLRSLAEANGYQRYPGSAGLTEVWVRRAQPSSTLSNSR